MTAPPSNLRRIGGEMFAWSDRDATRAPAVAGGGPLRHLVTELGGPDLDVLVAGPHDDDLVTTLVATGATVTCLCRSLTDAERLAELFPSVTVLCGAIAKLDPTPRYDLVVAFDGLDRLDSTEAGPQARPETLRILARTLRPEGTLAVLHDNPLGIHRLVELNPGRQHGTDADWYPTAEHDEQRPASVSQIDQHLRAEELTPVDTYAVYPTPRTPMVLIGRPLLGDTTSSLRGQLSAALAEAFTTAYRDTAVLSDPRTLTARALTGGAEGVLAPGWLTVARRGPATAPPAERALVGRADDTFLYELSVDEGRPRISVLAPPLTRPPRAGLRPVADPAAYVPSAGRVYEERLLRLCAHADLAGLRAEVSRLVGWIEAQATDGRVAGPAALVTPARLLDDGDELRLTVPRWEPTESVPVASVVAHALWSFAVRLITGGHPHPWPMTSSAADLTAILFGLVGRACDERQVRDGIELRVATDTAEGDLSLSEARSRRLELYAIQPGTATIDVPGYRELAEALWRQRYQTSHLLALMEWTEQMIKSRDYWHSKMDWELQLYRKTWFGRLLMLARNAYRLLRRDLRQLKRR